ncbi:hypothetical protein ACFZCP_13855 [Streptomyces sp. NPDC007971]|uniref:hypothetical protein n=1 Tax=Streptomyces sp. NPDC007971 TaxID=3364799 RepID=UPI0036E8DB5B
MSTEARRAPVPPRPSTPPPGHPRPPGHTPDTAPATPPPGTPTGSTRIPDGYGPLPDAALRRVPGAQRTPPATAPEDGDLAGDLDDEPSVFAPRPARTASAPATGEGEVRPKPRHTGGATGDDRPRIAAPRPSAVPEATHPASPPPPPASARFPDAPPSAGRRPHEPGPGRPAPSRPAHHPGVRPGSAEAPAGDAAAPAVPPRPVHDPGAPRRTEAPAESLSETTAPLRRIPPAPGRQRPAPASSSASGFPGSAPASSSATGRPGFAQGPSSAAGRPGSAQGSAAGKREPVAGMQEPAAGKPDSTPAPVSGRGDAPVSGRADGSVAGRGDTPAALRPEVPPRRPQAPAESPSETTTRLRPIPSAAGPGRPGATAGFGSPASASPASASPASASPVSSPLPPAREARTAWSPSDPAHPVGPAPSLPDPVFSWSAGAAARPVASFGEPERYDERMRTRPAAVRIRPRTAAAAACLVLGLGLIGGAVTGSWLTGDGDGEDGTAGSGFSAAATLWHSVPVDKLFPPTVQGTGAGPGGADRTWTRIAVAPDSGCADAFDPLLHKVLAPVGCQRLLRATYTDATQTYVTTVGLLFTKGDAASMSALAARFRREHLERRSDLMPRPYAAKGTAAAGFGARQRAAWTVSVLTDAPVVAYAVSGWADGRTVDAPQPAADATGAATGAATTTAPVQAGLGNEAQGLADRIERRLRQRVGSASSESPS